MRKAAACLILWICSASTAISAEVEVMPWCEAGINPRQAAAHLLNRFTFGPRPGEVRQILETGLENWFENQLTGQISEPRLERFTQNAPAWALSSGEILESYPSPTTLILKARAAGVIGADIDIGDLKSPGMADTRLAIYDWAESRGYHRRQELIDQLIEHKLIRAATAENQLAEVLTDFWFNHFNVSITDPGVRPYVLQYERDAIRPYVLGSFRDLLGATARHPAMLLYLDNAMSVGGPSTTSTMDYRLEVAPSAMSRNKRRALKSWAQRQMQWANDNPNRPTGLNENYARELLELHTLGVDGGYTQDDVVAVARAFSGWSVMPQGPGREEAERRLALVQRAGGLGFVHNSEFLFRADAHDAERKTVLGHEIDGGNGIEDGERVLDLVAAHPATARHVARKIAIRFVSDKPASELVEVLAASFTESAGSIPAVLRTLVRTPEFWAEANRPSKIKLPFEFAVSALRSVNAEVLAVSEIIDFINRMGQALYAYPPPTGWPETGDAWLGAAAIVARSTFAFKLAKDRVVGVSLPSLPAADIPSTSVRRVAKHVGIRMLPGRDLTLILEAVEKGAASSRANREAITLVLSSPEFQRR